MTYDDQLHTILRIQLADIRQDRSVLGLLSFSSLLLPEEEGEERVVRAWCNGQWTVSDDAFPDALPQRFNTVAVQRDFHTPKTIAELIDVTRAHTVFTVSPTSSLWAPIARGPYQNREAESLRGYFESIAQALAYRSIGVYPSLLDIHLSLRIEPSSPADCLRSSLPALCNGLSQCLRGRPLMGVADCSKLLSPADLLNERFMTPDDYREIGRRFPSLHPILIGEYGALSNMKEALQGRAVLIQVSDDTSIFRSGILYIPYEIVDAPETPVLLRSWLAEPEPFCFAGEYEVGGGKVLSLRRSRELESSGVLAQLPEGYVRYLLVGALHCSMIGVDPEDMLTYIGPASLVMRMQADIERELSQTNPNLPNRTRIWQAYESTAFKGLSRELKDLMRRLYFPDKARAERRVDG